MVRNFVTLIIIKLYFKYNFIAYKFMVRICWPQLGHLLADFNNNFHEISGYHYLSIEREKFTAWYLFSNIWSLLCENGRGHHVVNTFSSRFGPGISTQRESRPTGWNFCWTTVIFQNLLLSNLPKPHLREAGY